MGGRRPNPTYTAQRDALDEVIRSLRSMKADLTDDEAEQRRYSVYISDAEHDLYRVLASQQSSESHARELTAQAPESALALPEAPGATQERAPSQLPLGFAKTPLGFVLQAADSNSRPKHWDNGPAASLGALTAATMKDAGAVLHRAGETMQTLRETDTPRSLGQFPQTTLHFACI